MLLMLPAIYTLAEAAERMRTSRNAVARLARRTGHCAAVGRALLFSEDDLAALWEAMRVPTRPHPSNPSDRNIEQRAAAFLAAKGRKP